VSVRLVGQAIGLFAVTNIDDIVMLALFFGQAIDRNGVLRVTIGQYLGFAGILIASILGALGAALLPQTAIPYLGLLPFALGLRAAWTAWHERLRSDAGQNTARGQEHATGPGILAVAAVTLANGGDNIGVYVPVFAITGVTGLVTYVTVFLALVAVWCAAGLFFASRPLVARALARWDHILLPVVLVSIGLIILIDGHAFGL
jgi:cadmium resistance protein CadD (predicted permease)